MHQNTEDAAKNASTEPRTTQYREVWEPATEPWQRQLNNVEYVPKHARLSIARWSL